MAKLFFVPETNFDISRLRPINFLKDRAIKIQQLPYVCIFSLEFS